MNILFVGPYRQNDEWGYKSQAILNKLQDTGHNITARPIYMSSALNYNNYIEPSETNSFDSYDILIQFVLPSFAIYEGSFKKRIGIFHTETIPDNIPMAELASECLMDEIWVDSKLVAHNLQKIMTSYGATTQIRTLPPTLNIERLPKEFLLENSSGAIHDNSTNKLTTRSESDNLRSAPRNISIRDSSPHLKDKFIFYYIGDVMPPHSGFNEVYTAYLNAFSNQDSVALIIGLSTALNTTTLNEWFDSSKQRVFFNKPEREHPAIHVIAPQEPLLNLNEKLALHNSGDCFVDVAYTMSSSSTCLEAALYQNTPIVSRNSVAYEHLGDENVWCVDSYEDICQYPKQQIPPHLYRFSAEESWYHPIIKSLTNIMKQAYINKFERDKKKAANAKLRQSFQEISYNSILGE